MRVILEYNGGRTECIGNDIDEIKAMQDAMDWLEFEIKQRKTVFGGVPN